MGSDTTPAHGIRRQFASEKEVELVTGISRHALQVDRRRPWDEQRFPFYRFGRKILYDLDQVRDYILSRRGGQAA